MCVKGTVFIGWSSDTALARKVKVELKKYGYNATIGGDEGTVENLSIADTIASQIDECCQSVFIIKKNLKGLISNNITFEIGYSVSKYNLSMQKLHLFYLDIEHNDESIPSDLLGLWASHIRTEGKSEDEIVREMVDSFLSHQKAELGVNKMAVVTDWLGTYTKLSSHLISPRFTDFELAQYIFLLTESAANAHTWKESRELVEKFARTADGQSTDLSLAIRMFEITEEVNHYRKACGQRYYLDKPTFRMLRDKTRSFLEDVSRCTSRELDPIFAKWLIMFAKQKLQYFYMMNGNDPDVSDKTPMMNQAENINREIVTLCEELRAMDPARNAEFLWEMLFMTHRNLAVIAQFRCDRDLEKKERFESLHYTREIRGRYYGKIDSRVWETFEREYYVAVTECLEFMDSYEKEEYLEELQDYVEHMLELRDSNTVYINRIKSYLDGKPVSGL